MDDHEWTIDYAEQLIAEWRQRADRYEADGADGLAKQLRNNAKELEDARNAALGEPLTLTAAATLSGYTTSRLKQLLRAGTIPNAGTKGAPRIRRSDVPRRPGHGIEPAARLVDPAPTRDGQPSLAAKILRAS